MSADARRPRRELSLWRKLTYAALVWVAFFGLLELGLRLAGVESLLQREDPFRGFSGLLTVFERRGEVYRTRLPKPGGTFNDQSFRVDKPADGVRIFTLGGSSSYGFPWSSPVAFPAILGDVLAAAHPQRTVESVNASGVSYAMHRLNLVADELLDYEPDIFIVYSGHNEFVEPSFFEALKHRSPARNRLEYLLARTRVYSGLYRLLGGAQGHRDPAAKVGFDERVRRDDAHTYTPAAKAAVVAEFGWRLRRLVRRARERGVHVLLCTVPANLRDWRPERSLPPVRLDAADSRAWEAALSSGRARLQRQDHLGALSDLKRALELAPGHAGTRYLLGQALEGLGRWEEAAQAYAQACDADASPSRRLSAINQAIREVAADEGALLVDVEARFRELSPHGLVGFNLIEDYVHPTLEGHREIAWTLWQALADSGWLGAPAPAARARFDRIVGQRQVPDPQANPSWLYNQGIVLSVQGRDELAMERFRQTLALEPTHGGAMGNLVGLLLKQGRDQEALPLAEKLVALYPEYPNFQLYLAMILKNNQQVPRARQHFERVLALRPGDPLAHYQLGVILEGEGDTPAASEHYRRALAAQPDFPEARARLAALEAGAGGAASR